MENILKAVLEMAAKRQEANTKRKGEERYPEFKRVRLGTKLPIYLPQRITPKLIEVLGALGEKLKLWGSPSVLFKPTSQVPWR